MSGTTTKAYPGTLDEKNDTEMRLTPRPSLLVVDDDRELCRLVSEYLEPEGFQMKAVHTGAEGVRAALAGDVQLIVLDVMLPDIKGFDVLRTIRKSLTTPVLMLTAKGDDFDRILGLELGADDYLAKPFNPRELVARITAILRRVEWRETSAAARPAQLQREDLTLDPASRIVTRSGIEVKLTSAEFDLLTVFLESMGTVLSREYLVERVLERKFSPFDRSIDLHVSNLRRKLGPRPRGGERIRSVRYAGYLYIWPEA